jgi:surface protein
MTVLKASNAPVGLNKGKPNRAANTPQPVAWVRPADWVTFTTPSSSDQKVIGTVAVYNQDSNYIALGCTVSSGTYTVDWGDGTSANFVNGTTAQKNYTYSSLSSGTLSSRGYRQAVITVTPTTVGATFTAVNLDRLNTSITSASSLASNPWLDVAIAAPNATAIRLSYILAATRTVSMSLCEQVNIVAHNLTDTSYLFRELRVLQSVPLFNTSAVTNMSNMFSGCYSLQSVPLLDTSSATNMSNMFFNCYSLKSVPLFNTANNLTTVSMFSGCTSLISVPLLNTIKVIDMNLMFNNCVSLITVPLFNTIAVTNMSNMFNGCSALQSVPLFNTAAVTTMNSMFIACRSLQTVPLFNTGLVSNMTLMFNNCVSLITVPLFNTVAVTTMSSMFATCNSLQTVPLFNTALVANMSNMFQTSIELQTVPLFNTAAVTDMANMFNGCSALQSVPLFNTSAVTNISGMLANCTSLTEIPLFNTSAATNISAMVQGISGLPTIAELNLSSVAAFTVNSLGLGNATATAASANLGRAKLTGNRWTQSFQNCKLGATQLDEMYTALAVLNPSVTNVTSSGTVVTYTVDDRRAFVAGRTVTMTGIVPSAYNLVNATVGVVTAGVGNAGTFTVTNTATGTFISGGVATLQDNKTITVTSNPGTATDTPTIATNKGWTVTG